MSDGAKHFDTTTQGGLIAAAWWDALTENEREAVLRSANTTQPWVAYQLWQRIVDHSQTTLSKFLAVIELTKERDALRAVLREIVSGWQHGYFDTVVMERAQKLIEGAKKLLEPKP